MGQGLVGAKVGEISRGQNQKGWADGFGFTAPPSCPESRDSQENARRTASWLGVSGKATSSL